MAAPKRQYLPFIFLSLFAIVFYSYHHSSLQPPLSFIPNDNPSFNHFQINPNPNFSLTIKVLTFNRLDSLSRCLRSLAKADYDENTVNLHVYIDHFPYVDSVHKDFAALDLKLEDSRRILDFVDGFVWNFGEKLVHYRTGNVGLQAQWLEAWWPSSDDEFAFVVEDDLEVSRLYYKFLKSLIVNFYYNATNFSPSIYGASLQRARFVPGKHGYQMHLESERQLFLYQLVGTWGQLLFPKPWKEFRFWYDTHKAKGIKPFLQGMVTTGWYKKMGERIWTPWFIKFIHSRGYFNIYTNFLYERALSISHRDAGVNYGKTVGPDSFLLDESSLDFNLLEMQPISYLKWYDFCFREVLPGRIVRSFNELESVLYSVQKQDTVVVVSLFRASEAVIMNLLCHFERINMYNYIFIGQNESFLHDLARRGHPVIVADQLFDSIKAFKLMGLREPSLKLVKEILVKAYVVKKCLEYKYDSWLVDGNMIFNRSDLFLDFFDSTYDIYAGKMTELFFVRSSSSVQKIWAESSMKETADMVDSLMSKGLLPNDERNFVYAITTLLEQKGIRIKKVDEESIGLQIDVNNVTQTSPLSGKNLFFWSSKVDLQMVQKRLEGLGMWIIDSDSSCMAVVCHQAQ